VINVIKTWKRNFIYQVSPPDIMGICLHFDVEGFMLLVGRNICIHTHTHILVKHRALAKKPWNQ